MQIQTIPLSQLSPHPRNVRKTGGTSIHDLACSIAANGPGPMPAISTAP